MRMKLFLLFVYLEIIAILSGCTSNLSLTNTPGSHKSSENSKKIINLPSDGMKCELIEIICDKSDSDSDAPKIRYLGTYQGIENVIGFKFLAQDIYCADRFKEENFPNGFVTIFGSSRIPSEEPQCNKNEADCLRLWANYRAYEDIREFARIWTMQYGGDYPILTGAGAGLMEAGSRGAMESVLAEGDHPKGKSIGYSTYYDKQDPIDGLPTPKYCVDEARPYCGNPKKAFRRFADKGVDKNIITDGLIFSSVAMREYAMIKHSAAIIIGPGGMGTEWEIVQTIETIKSLQLKTVPVFLTGNAKIHWQSFFDRLSEMNANQTIHYKKQGNILYIGDAIIEHIENTEDLIDKLALKLNLK